MGIKKGMYVRINRERYNEPIYITKIDSKSKYGYTMEDHYIYREEEFVKPPTFNILEILEVGDYVNGNRIIDINITKGYVIVDTHENYIYCNKIKDVVTKEQFESMKYEVN